MLGVSGRFSYFFYCKYKRVICTTNNINSSIMAHPASNRKLLEEDTNTYNASRKAKNSDAAGTDLTEYKIKNVSIAVYVHCIRSKFSHSRLYTCTTTAHYTSPIIS